MGKHAGRKAVVIGGTHGMGRAVADALIEGGADVLLTGHNPRTVEAAQRALDGRAHVVPSDIADLGEVKALAVLVAQRMGRIDFAFINAGYARLDPFAEVNEEVYDRTFDINTKGAFFTAQHLAPLIRDGGALVFTTSIANGSGTPGMSVYSGAKAAVRAFAKVMAAELLPRGIRVNAVSPGFIDTPTMGVAEATAADLEAFRRIGDAVTPMKRHGTVEEVARAVLFLAFDATFTTGVELTVDGGLAQQITSPAP